MFFSATDEKSVEKEISVDPIIGEASTNGAGVAGDAYMKYDPIATNELDKIVNAAVQTAIGAAASNMVERLYAAPEFVAAASNAVDQVKIATETKAIEIALLEAKAKAVQDGASVRIGGMILPIKETGVARSCDIQLDVSDLVGKGAWWLDVFVCNPTTGETFGHFVGAKLFSGVRIKS